MLEALIYLAAAVIFVPLAQRFALGSVLGYLIAGVVIGPWGLSLVKDVTSIMHFSEFGVVLMLFLIGLELDPKRLWSMRHAVFGGGSLQILLCGLLLALGLSVWLGLKAGIVTGLALALSSTAIAVQTMKERNLLTTPLGKTSFAMLLFQDIAAIPLLAVIPLLASHATNADTPFWLGATKACGAIIGVVLIGRYLTRPLLRLIAAAELREVFTAFALLLVIGIAQLMTLADLSMGLGAFLAGVLLASSEYRHALETDIEPFKGLLLGLFFISVGMSINLGLLHTDLLAVIGLLVGFTVIKLLALWFTARLMQISPTQRGLFAIVIAQGGEFGFVVFGAAHLAGLVSAQQSALLTMTVALSMMITPFLLLLHDRWQQHQQQRIPQQADTIDESEAPVIIAGFGRMGQIVGRLLFANHIRAVVLDHDPEQIELLRKFSYKVFYGDATRLDLLHAAGASHAKLIINAIDDIEDSLILAELVQQHFPNLTMIARARNVTHYIDLRQMGVQVVERETFESALRLGRYALEALQIDPFRAREMADTFRRHNIETLEKMRLHIDDETRVLSAAKASREELSTLFDQDRQRFDQDHPQSWN